jgi:hypothetical protein
MRNGHTIAQVDDSKTDATVAYVQNEKGTVTAREVTYSTGLGEERTFSVPEPIAQVLQRTGAPLTAAVKRSLKA